MKWGAKLAWLALGAGLAVALCYALRKMGVDIANGVGQGINNALNNKP